MSILFSFPFFLSSGPGTGKPVAICQGVTEPETASARSVRVRSRPLGLDSNTPQCDECERSGMCRQCHGTGMLSPVRAFYRSVQMIGNPPNQDGESAPRRHAHPSQSGSNLPLSISRLSRNACRVSGECSKAAWNRSSARRQCSCFIGRSAGIDYIYYYSSRPAVIGQEAGRIRRAALVVPGQWLNLSALPGASATFRYVVAHPESIHFDRQVADSPKWLLWSSHAPLVLSSGSGRHGPEVGLEEVWMSDMSRTGWVP